MLSAYGLLMRAVLFILDSVLFELLFSAVVFVLALIVVAMWQGHRINLARKRAVLPAPQADADTRSRQR